MTCVINIIHKTEPLHYFIAYKTANVFTVVMKITPYQCHCKAKQSTFVRAKRSLSSISLLIVIINIESNSLCISPLTRLVIHKRAQVVKAKETKLYYIKKQKELFHIDPLKALSKAKTFCLNSYFVRKLLLWARFWLLHLFFWSQRHISTIQSALLHLTQYPPTLIRNMYQLQYSTCKCDP